MSITYTWSFPQFDTIPSEDGLEDVVKTVHWRLDAAEDEYSAGAYGTIGLGAPEAGNFLAFDDLTSEWAIEAVKAQVSYEELVAALSAQIQNQKTPKLLPKKPAFS